jgi:hypothetical protein
MEACTSSSLDIVKAILTYESIDVSVHDQNGLTAPYCVMQNYVM